MWRKFLCFIGFHKWKSLNSQPTGNGDFQVCEHCPTRRVVIFAMLESDLRKLRDEGKISEDAYQNSLRKGYVDGLGSDHPSES